MRKTALIRSLKSKLGRKHHQRHFIDAAGKHKSLLLGLLIFISAIHTVQAEDRLKIGLALSGGGARGAAHIGVLQELERLRIPIDYIAGTSMGAIVGAMYASGLTTDKMERVLVETDWDEIFKDRPPRRQTTLRRKTDDRFFQINREIGVKDGKVRLPSGFIQGHKLKLLLDKVFLPVASIDNFNQLGIPFRAVATDITDGKAVVLKSGSLSNAVRASMSVPPAFAPLLEDDQILVDGGIANNLPVDVVREMGADIVIAVDIGTPFQPKEQLSGAIGITSQLTNILVRRTTEEQKETLSENDILIQPKLGDFSSADFKNASQVIANGNIAVNEVSDKLSSLALPLEQHERHVANRITVKAGAPMISFINIDNQTSLTDDYILSRIRQRTNQPLDLDQLEEDITVIYGLEIFQSVNYKIVEDSGKSGLVIITKSKTWGPRYLQFGISYTSDGASENDLGIRLGYTTVPLNAWNAELRYVLNIGEEPGLIGEYYQPLGDDSPYFFNSILSFTNNRFNTFENDSKINQIRAKKTQLSLSFGREFGYSSDLRLGFNRSRSENNVEIGLPDKSVSNSNGGELFLRYRLDTLDSPFFPKQGMALNTEWINSRSGLGSDNEFDQLLFDYLGAVAFGEHTFNAGIRYFSTVEGVAPIQSQFRLGGLFNLPGFSNNELSGQNLYLIRTAYQRPLFDTAMTLGVTLQYGDIYENDDNFDLSEGITALGAWVGRETPLGPVYLGLGSAENDNNSVYIILGKSF